MGLSLAGLALTGPHVLPLEAPGAWRIRAHAERRLLGRGWRMARSPADADVLLVCGDPGPALSGAAERLWDQLPGPRTRQTARSLAEVDRALDAARAELAHAARQRRDATTRAAGASLGDQGTPSDHGDDDMAMAPSGIRLAQGADDRDRLEMDVLHVPLGPALPYWPAGLVLHCTLHGDVVAAAALEDLDAPGDRDRMHGHDPRSGQRREEVWARGLDAARDVLALAGWDAAAQRAREVRDALLDGAAAAPREAQRLRRRVAHSRILRWSLHGLGRFDDPGLPASVRGDVHDRLLALIAGEAVADPGVRDRLPELVEGLDLAAVRLVVASLTPALTPEPARSPGVPS